MIGLGTWEAEINTFVFRGIGRMTISDVNGNYDFKFELVGQNLPEIRVSEIEENGNTLTAVGECDALIGQKVPVSITFEDDRFTGTIKAPIIGKLKLKGKKIA